MLLQLLLLPLSLPSRIGCRASNALADSLDALVRLAQRPRPGHGPRSRPPNDDAH